MARTIEVIIEIPKGSRNKYEFDHVRNVLKLDRRLFVSMDYPTDYGFVPDTLAEDGDPLDILVLVEEPTVPGCYMDVRPVGILWMEDEAGPDAKVLCVPKGDPAFEHVQDIGDVRESLLAEIKHFFDVYKDLEPNKTVTTKGWGTAAEAWQEHADAVERFARTPVAH